MFLPLAIQAFLLKTCLSLKLRNTRRKFAVGGPVLWALPIGDVCPLPGIFSCEFLSLKLHVSCRDETFQAEGCLIPLDVFNSWGQGQDHLGCDPNRLFPSRNRSISQQEQSLKLKMETQMIFPSPVLVGEGAGRGLVSFPVENRGIWAGPAFCRARSCHAWWELHPAPQSDLFILCLIYSPSFLVLFCFIPNFFVRAGKKSNDQTPHCNHPQMKFVL